MNRREQAVLLLVTVAFLLGFGIFYYKRARFERQAALNPIAVVQEAPGKPLVDSVGLPSPVDLNHATVLQLEGLPGIGPVLAGRIVEYRRRKGGFRHVGELQSVSGIGKKRYSVLKEMVMVGLDPTAADSGR